MKIKPGLPARAAATIILTRVIDDGRGLDGLLDSRHGPQAFANLSDADKSLVRAIATTTFRHRGEIEFALSKNLPAEEREKLTSRFMRLVELEGFASYYPSKLSGGMRQRVSIARAFAYPSDIILMDEPLKGLDIKLKLNLIRTFSRIWQTDKRTVIFVTHDVDEALLLGDEIVVLSRAPVTIAAQEKVEVPIANRSLDSDYLKELKQVLLNALG